MARQIASEERPSFITNYIEAEAHALLLRKLGRAIARQWLLTGGLPVVRALPAEEPSAKEILARHTDKDWILCDAISCSTPATWRGRSHSTTISGNIGGFRYSACNGERPPCFEARGSESVELPQPGVNPVPTGNYPGHDPHQYCRTTGDVGASGDDEVAAMMAE